MKPKIETIVLAADLAGTFIFAIEGAVAAMRGGLDLLGVMGPPRDFPRDARDIK